MGHIQLDSSFHKDIQWFLAYLPHTNGIYITSPENREPVQLFMDACGTGCGELCQQKAYHKVFPEWVLAAQHPICQLEALNALVTVRRWVPSLKGRLVHPLSDSTMAVAIFQPDMGGIPSFRPMPMKFG